MVINTVWRGLQRRIKNATQFSWKTVIFHVCYPIRLINHAWTTRIHSYLHKFTYTAKRCTLQDKCSGFLCTVTLVSCPFIFRAVWPYFKAYIQHDMSQPQLMRCVGWLLYGKQLEASPLPRFHSVASLLCIPWRVLLSASQPLCFKGKDWITGV